MKKFTRALLALVLLLLIAIASWRWATSYSGASLPPASELTVSTCPAIHDTSLRPLGELDDSGRVARITHEGWDDRYLFDRAEKFKIGLREQWGGALVFFGEAQGGANVLDASALDRGVQTRWGDNYRSAPCREDADVMGWLAAQSGDSCGQTSGVADIDSEIGLGATTVPVLLNPMWNAKDCTSRQQVCGRGLPPQRGPLRVHESLRFVTGPVVEVEVLVTNLGPRDLTARHDFPLLSAARELNQLQGAGGALQPAEPRSPASAHSSASEFQAPGGWATWQGDGATTGVGIYWENRQDSLRVRQVAGQVNSLSSNLQFTIPAQSSVRGRFYLLLGDSKTLKALADNLDKTLPPFGRIETNQINEDTRTVTLSGWALDNKKVRRLELWVDGGKVSDLSFNQQREDICAEYPGYSMCREGHMRVGFETVYPRPLGHSCERSVEVRAADEDGNLRVIARKSISPVVETP